MFFEIYLRSTSYNPNIICLSYCYKFFLLIFSKLSTILLTDQKSISKPNLFLGLLENPNEN